MVIMAIRINGIGPLEDLEVKVGEFWVVMQLVFEEVKKNLRGDRRFKMGFEEG